MPKLTKRIVDAARPEPAGDVFLWDDALPGFGLRVKPSGTKTYLVQYRNDGGRTRRLAIGRHGVIATEQAREKARAVLVDVTKGADPSAERQARRAAPTVAALCDRFLDEYGVERKKPRSLTEDRQNIDRFIRPALGTMKVQAVTRGDVLKLHHGLKATPYQANRMRACLSKMLNLAELWGLRPDGSNPCRHVKPYAEMKRERFLSAAELARLGDTLAEADRTATEPAPVIAALRLLILTGCRLSEVLTVRWEHVDFESRCLRLPDSKTGAKVVHLNAPALEVLSRLPRVDGNPYVIVGRAEEARLNDLERPWRRIRARAGLECVRLHDLRHSFASVAAGLGEGLPMIGKLLGHTQAATTHRYAHLASDPVKAATEKVGAALAGMMTGHRAEVVPMRQHKA